MSGDQVRRVGVLMEPLDTLFFRDGRPFEPASQVSSGMPMPQTVAGALRTWLLREADCDFERLAAAMRGSATFADAAADQSAEVACVARLSFRGPWFARISPGDAVEPLVPAPATLRKVKGAGEIARLDPLEKPALPGWCPPEEGMLPLWYCGGETIERLEASYLTPAGLYAFLQGKTPGRDEIVPRKDILDFDRRTGIAVDAGSRTAAEGMIYGVSLLALKRGVVLYAEVEGPDDAIGRIPGRTTPVPLGGEGRRVAMRTVEPVTWLSPAQGDGQGRLLVLTTPGIFDEGWRPSWLAGKLLAAAVPGYEAASGWDLARKGPKPTRFAAPAGSVYFLREPLDPPRGSLCDGEDAALGWGTFVEGVWKRV